MSQLSGEMAVTSDASGPDVAAMRRDYTTTGASTFLVEEGLAGTWLAQFRRWLAEATSAGIVEPNAMVLGTADPAGRPSARTVLLKGLDEGGFTFFTNLRSRKAREATANPYASLVFAWHAMGRQVVVCGRVEPVDRAEVEAYYRTRPRASQLGAWASPQSQAVADRAALDAALAEAEQRFPDSSPVPAPPHWGGLRVVPDTVEFWQGRAGRLHDRLCFRRSAGSGWLVERLAP